MARPISVEKLGYYPASPGAIDWIAQFLVAKEGAVICDPCAGEGRAVQKLARILGVPETHVVANELHAERSAKLAERLPEARVSECCDFQSASFEGGGASLLYLNPPFDNETGGGGRVELTFLGRAIRMIRRGGVLAYVVPQRTADRWDVKESLSCSFEDITVRPFPEEERPFGEVLVLGRRRETMVAASWRESCNTNVETYSVPKGRPFDIIKQAYTDEELEEVIERSGFVRKILTPIAHGGEPSDCPLELRDGHVALLLAAGHLNGLVEVPGEPPHLVRGTSRKVQFEKSRTQEVVKKKIKDVVVMSERIELVLRIATQDGTIRSLDD